MVACDLKAVPRKGVPAVRAAPASALLAPVASVVAERILAAFVPESLLASHLMSLPLLLRGPVLWAYLWWGSR